MTTMQITNIDADRMNDAWRPSFSFTTTITLPNGEVSIADEVWVLVEDRDPSEFLQYRRVAARPGQNPGWVVKVDTREALDANLERVKAMDANLERIKAMDASLDPDYPICIILPV